MTKLPPLPLDERRPTKDTLHLWAQIIALDEQRGDVCGEGVYDAGARLGEWDVALATSWAPGRFGGHDG